MRESLLEHRLTRAIQATGGLCWKLTSPGINGVPDRLIILPTGTIVFAEIKAPNQKPRPIQTKRINQLKKLQAHVYIIDNPNKITQLINDYKQGTLE